MSEVSDAWQKGFETGNKAVRKLADKEIDKLRAENERLRANPWQLFDGSFLRDLASLPYEKYKVGVVGWIIKTAEFELARREALKEGKP